LQADGIVLFRTALAAESPYAELMSRRLDAEPTSLSAERPSRDIEEAQCRKTISIHNTSE
jgi:hypothetical protein